MFLGALSLEKQTIYSSNYYFISTFFSLNIQYFGQAQSFVE